MGTDYYYCAECCETHRCDYFLQCKICDATFDVCDTCYEDKNNFASYKSISHDEHRNVCLLICDNCIKQFESKDIDKIENLTQYDIEKHILINNIYLIKTKCFSFENYINNINNEITELQKKIKDLRRERNIKIKSENRKEH